jgi:RNA-splicing ligase RtcB
MIFTSSAHGPWRRLIRYQTSKLSAGTDMRKKLKKNGILVFSFSNCALQDEMKPTKMSMTWWIRL